MNKSKYTKEQLKKWNDIYEALPKNWSRWLKEAKKELGEDKFVSQR